MPYRTVLNGFVLSTNKNIGEISGSHDGEYEDDFFWDVAPGSLVETDRRFRRAYCPHHQGLH
jgi:hypothetical protein